MIDSVPATLTGLWRREVITAPGLRDETTQVVWLQTGRWYVDLRIEADRPGPAASDGFAAYDDAALLALARTQGFAGQFSVSRETCLWRRDLDHQPPGPLPDEARYSVDGEVMVEDGIHVDYQEIWRRAPDSNGPVAAFRREATDGRSGLLVVAGRHMMELVARPGPPPEGDSLSTLVGQALVEGRRGQAEALLDTQIRYATRERGVWLVRLSSLPWLEGRAMWASDEVGYADGRLNVPFREGRAAWTLIDSNLEPEALAMLITSADKLALDATTPATSQ